MGIIRLITRSGIRDFVAVFKLKHVPGASARVLHRKLMPAISRSAHPQCRRGIDLNQNELLTRGPQAEQHTVSSYLRPKHHARSLRKGVALSSERHLRSRIATNAPFWRSCLMKEQSRPGLTSDRGTGRRRNEGRMSLRNIILQPPAFRFWGASTAAP